MVWYFYRIPKMNPLSAVLTPQKKVFSRLDVQRKAWKGKVHKLRDGDDCQSKGKAIGGLS